MGASDVEETAASRLGIERVAGTAASTDDSVPNVTRPALPVSFAPKIGSTMRRVCTAVRRLLSPLPLPASAKIPGLHEERPLLAEEGRKALVHFHLERIALDLAEIGLTALSSMVGPRPILPPNPTSPRSVTVQRFGVSCVSVRP